VHLLPFEQGSLILNHTYRHDFHPLCRRHKLSDTVRVAVAVMHVPLTLYPVTRYTLNPSHHQLYSFPAETRYLMVKFRYYSQYCNALRLNADWSLGTVHIELWGVPVMLVGENLHVNLAGKLTLILSIRHPITD
jgi:hypothetical protein